MIQPKATTIRCSSCGSPVNAQIRTVIDAGNDPEGKMLLVSGQLNSVPCPNCGTVNTIKTPLLYHDGSKELLIAFVPGELGLHRGKDEEKVVGDMLNELTSSIPKEDFRGYMFNPKRTLTEKGLIDQILEADGITPEMMAQQQKRVDFLQKLLDTEHDKLTAVIQEHDAEIDEALVQTLSMMVARLMQSGQQQLVSALAHLQEHIIEASSFGKEMRAQQEAQQAIVESVADDIEELGDDADQSDFYKLIVSYQDDDDRVQALVGLIRPVFDYQFFELMTTEMAKVPADEQAKLEALRDRLLDLTKSIDEQSRAVMQQSLELLQAIANSPDYEAMIHQNLHAIDDNFMGLLRANIEESARRGDSETSKRLTEIYDVIVSLLRNQMQPELRFVNDLLNIAEDDVLRSEIQAKAPEYGDVLLEVIDAVSEVLAAQGQQQVLNRVQFIRAEAVKALS